MNGPAGRKRKTQHTKKDAMKFVAKILTIAAALSSLSMGANQVTVDSSIKPYAPTSGVSGNLERRRLRYAEQPDDPLGGRIQKKIPQRQSRR